MTSSARSVGAALDASLYQILDDASLRAKFENAREAAVLLGELSAVFGKVTIAEVNGPILPVYVVSVAGRADYTEVGRTRKDASTSLAIGDLHEPANAAKALYNFIARMADPDRFYMAHVYNGDGQRVIYNDGSHAGPKGFSIV